jgi:hypothetical protein
VMAASPAFLPLPLPLPLGADSVISFMAKLLDKCALGIGLFWDESIALRGAMLQSGENWIGAVFLLRLI